MNLNKYIIVFILSQLASCFCFSQNALPDSLSNLLKKAKHDSSRCNILVSAITAENDMDLAGRYNKRLMDICESNLQRAKSSKPLLTLYKKHYAFALCLEAAISEQTNDIDKALECYIKSLTFSQEINDSTTTSIVFNNIATIYSKKGSIEMALEYNFKSLKIKEAMNDKVGMGYSYCNIGLIYSNQNDSKLAIEYYLKSLKIREDINDKEGIAESLLNIGAIYKKQNNFSNALDYFNKSLKIAESINDKKNIAFSFYHIGNIYFTKVDYVKALDNLTKALKVAEEINSKYLTAISLGDIGLVYIAQKDYTKALDYTLKSMALTKELGYPKEIAKEALRLNSIYKSNGDYKKALEYYEVYVKMNDSINNQAVNKATVKSKFKYEYEKKAATDSLKVAEEKKLTAVKLKQEKTQRYALYGGLCLVVLFSLFMVNRFRVTNKQKIIIEEQKHIVEEKQTEILDSINYAKRIQYSLLASTKLLNDNLPEYFLLFKPKDVVSGDFYWGSKLSNGNFVLVTADSTGHGVPGAIMSMLNISCLNEAINADKLVEPSDILNATRRTVIDHLSNDGSAEGGKDGMDCSLVSFDFTNRKLFYSAANNPVWIIRNKTFIALAADRMPIGKHDKDAIPFTQNEFDLQSGDMVYTLTDGFPDQFGGPKGKKFKYKQLEELLISIAHESMEHQKKKLNDVFENWKGGLEQVDDVCIIGVRV